MGLAPGGRLRLKEGRVHGFPEGVVEQVFVLTERFFSSSGFQCSPSMPASKSAAASMNAASGLDRGGYLELGAGCVVGF